MKGGFHPWKPPFNLAQLAPKLILSILDVIIAYILEMKTNRWEIEGSMSDNNKTKEQLLTGIHQLREELATRS